QLLRRQFAQLVIDQRQELLRGVGITLLNGGQDARDFAHATEDNTHPLRPLFKVNSGEKLVQVEICFSRTINVGARFGQWDEWHLDFEKIVTLEKLGDCPACPDSRKEPRSKCHSSMGPKRTKLAVEMIQFYEHDERARSLVNVMICSMFDISIQHANPE